MLFVKIFVNKYFLCFYLFQATLRLNQLRLLGGEFLCVTKPFYTQNSSFFKQQNSYEGTNHIFSLTPQGTILLYPIDLYPTTQINGPFPHHPSVLFAFSNV